MSVVSDLAAFLEPRLRRHAKQTATARETLGMIGSTGADTEDLTMVQLMDMVEDDQMPERARHQALYEIAEKRCWTDDPDFLPEWRI